MKPVPKYVGYAAKDLGVLLVQNSKDVLTIEHANPMAIVRIKSGNINETQFLEGFNNLFSWNWKQRAKSHGRNCYWMRFPNKAKLIELTKVDDFNLLGTGAVVNVQSWSFDSQAIGKLHTMQVRFGKVPECFRHFFGLCETAASLGPVLEIDMDTISLEKLQPKLV